MTALDRRFAALAHPLRRSMLARLSDGERTISELAADAPMTFAAVSRHLRVLEDAALVSRVIRGREHVFAARPDGLSAAAEWIARQSAHWQRSLEALKTMVEADMGTGSALRATAEIHVAASPDRVFAAWTDPRQARRFLCAGETTVADIRLEPEPGGELFVIMMDGDRPLMHRGEFLVVDPPRRLVFTWMSQPTDLALTVVSVDFIGERGGTTVRLVHEGFRKAAAAPMHSRGWQSILAKLAGIGA